MKKVCVVIPVYNAGDKLEKCLDSIRGQTYRNMQIFLIDDGSEDGSLEICNHYAQSDERFRVLSHENHGVSYTRNRGIDASDGAFLIFVDSDDCVLEDYIQRYVEAAEQWEADVVVGGVRFCEWSGKCHDLLPEQQGKFGRKELLEAVCLCGNGLFGYTPNKLYRLSVIKENQIYFREDMAAQEDLEFALSVYQKAQTFFLLPYAGYLYDYVPSGRTVPVRDLLGNQQKLLHLAQAAECGECSQMAVANKIWDMTYTALFWCEGVKQIERIGNFVGLKKDIGQVRTGSFEKKMVHSWFLNGKYRRIFRYFSFRNGIKRLMGKC